MSDNTGIWKIAILGLDDSILELAWRCCRVNFEIVGIYHSPHEEALRGALRLGCSAYSTPDFVAQGCDLILKSPHFELPPAADKQAFWIQPLDASSNHPERLKQFYEALETAEKALPS